jgi:hypothetical protein
MSFLANPDTKYAPVTVSPRPSSFELSPPPVVADSERLRPVGQTHLGEPRCKPSLNKIDLCTVLASFACLAASICVVTPHLTLAWRLKFNGQIIVIGFLLSIMNLLMKRIAPTLFLILESRWGSSRLQNYDAILRNTMSLSKTGFFWRATLFVFLFLPLGLSVGYKRFTGGRSSAVISSGVEGHYGLALHPLGDFNTMNNSIYFMIDANVPFMAASSDDSFPPPFATMPTAYGYNTLLLDNGTAAMLDMPLPDYMSWIQQQLTGSDFWQVSASVNATVTRYNTSIESYRSNDTFWNETVSQSWYGGVQGVSFFNEFNGYALGYLPGIQSKTDGASCLVGNFKSSSPGGWFAYSNDITTPEFVAFRAAALMFTTRRERCMGTWLINRTAVVLMDGSCSGERTNQDPLSEYVHTPYPLDTMPVLVHSLLSYSDERNQSLWLLPAFATSMASAYWARLAYMLPGALYEYQYDSELNYPATDEFIASTTITLDASWLLFCCLPSSRS